MRGQLSLFDSLKAEVKAMPNGIVPRDYQSKAIDKAFDLWAQGSKGVIMRQPTGSGKTVTGTLVADRWLQEGKNHRVLVLAHERQLVHQFADEVEDILKVKPGIEMADEVVKANKMPKVVIASRATLYEREVTTEEGDKESASRLYKFDVNRYKWLIILDEVHRWQWRLKSCRHILEHFKNCPRLGLTATPMRGDGHTLAKVVPDVAADYRLMDIDGGPCAVLDGWAVPYDQRFVTVEGVDFKNIREIAKDFAPAALEEALTGDYKIVLGMLSALFELVADRRTIIFNPTVDMSKLVSQTINAWGPKWAKETSNTPPGEAIHIDGSFPDHARKGIYYRHQTGQFQFLSVVGLCREGYNDPGIGAVAVFRPTKSRGLAEQMKGRGCRPLRGCVDSNMTREERLAAIAASEKSMCMIIDLVGITGMADCATTAHLLAEGKPDEVIDRANENALKKDGPIDMAEEVRKAQSEIDEEREQARLNRLEKERLEKEEAERRAKLKAEVRYSQRQVKQGQGSTVHQPKREARMIWGKHKGQPVADVPTDYLEWVQGKKLPYWLNNAIRRELQERNGGPIPAGPSDMDHVNRMFQESW